MDAFSACGRVLQVRIPVDAAGRPKGIALVVMEDEHAKARAATELDNACVLGRFIRLDANPGSRRT
ncbi:hypothetical protein FOA52_002312 [Chlamydomonas sp. UWO 241]|nr:hypothetical protein FOA52_002312 [Chlamydomonas sp. UWO 241]